MKVVWRLDKATVRDVYEALREQRTDRLHHGDDDDEDSRGEGVPQEDAGRARLRLPAGAAAAAGRRRDGAGLRRLGVRRRGRRVDAAPREGPAASKDDRQRIKDLIDDIED